MNTLAKLTLGAILIASTFSNIQIQAQDDPFEAGVQAYQQQRFQAAERFWLSITSGANLAAAAYNLAVLYESGRGARREANSVFNWYQRAARLGSPDGQFNFGGLFFDGKIVARNIERALYWWSQAANQNHTLAQYNLGIVYMNGNIAPQNLPLAKDWFSVAAQNGSTEAQNELAKVHLMMQQQMAESMLNDSLSRNELWILRRPPNHFTVKITTVDTYQKAQNFIQQSNTQGVVYYYLDRSNEGQSPQIVLVGGTYKTRGETQKQIKELNPSIQALSPKPVKWSVVHKALRGE